MRAQSAVLRLRDNKRRLGDLHAVGGGACVLRTLTQTESTRRVVRLENLTQYGYRGTTVCQAPPLWQLGSLPHHVEGATSGPSRGGEKVEIET